MEKINTLPPLEISLLRSFVAIARLGSISAAALQLGRTQSALSTQMKRLEQIAGAAVLHRTGSGVRLTKLGERLLSHAISILTAHDEALSDLTGDGLQGSLRFGCPEDYLDAFLPDALALFSAQHPDVEIEIACAPTSELKPMLDRGYIDAALVSELSTAASKDILRSVELVWIGKHPRPDILEDEILPLALSAPNTLDHQVACEAMRRKGLPYRIAFAANGMTALLAIARSGHAISAVTEIAVPSDLVVIREPLPPLAEIGIALARSTGPGGKALDSFCDIVTDVVSGVA